jgi:PAS domain S-box-containing protein
MSRERIEKYKEFAQCIEYPMIIFEAESGKVLHINYEAETVFGKQVEQVLVEPGRTMIEQDFWDTLHSRKSLMWHRLRLVADGHKHAISGFVNESEVDGTVIYTILFESQMKLGGLVLERVLSQAGIVSIHLTGHSDDMQVEFVSKNVNAYGYTREQFYTGSIRMSDFVCEEDWERVRGAVKKGAELHLAESVLECRIFTETRELVPVRLHVQYDYSEYGKFQALEILVYDLREELYNKQENDYLTHAIEKMKSVVMVKKYKPGKRELCYVSPNAGMVGMNVEALQEGLKLTEDYIHPADRDKVIDTIYQAIANGVTDYVHTYRMVRDDGKQIWVLSEMTVNRNDDGEAQISFLLTDITEQKMMEQELSEVRENLAGETAVLEEHSDLDMSTIDESDKDVLKQLQTLTEVLNSNADYYNVVLDTEAKLLTKPVGHVKEMGQFYDLFERPQFKEQFASVTQQVKEQMIPVSTTFSVDALQVSMVFAPVLMKDVVAAYWVLAGFGKMEEQKLGDAVEQQWKLANVITKGYYADEMAERENKLRRLSELQLEKEQQGRQLMKEFMEELVEKGEAALSQICHKTSLYMNVVNIGIYVVNRERGNAEKYFTWNQSDEDTDFFNQVALSVPEYESLMGCMKDNRLLVVDNRSSEMILKELLCRSGVESFMVHLMTVGKQQGYVVFAGNRKYHEFDERDKEIGAMVTHLFEEMLIRSHNNNNAETTKDGFLEAYEYIREAVFIKDNRSGEIIYANNAMKKLFGRDVVGADASSVVYDEMAHYKNMDGIRKRFINNKKVVKWQSYMKELDQIMSIVEIRMSFVGRDCSLMILKKSKNKGKNKS